MGNSGIIGPRVVTREIMDLPGIDQSAHRQALAGLRRINRLSQTVQQILEPIRLMCQREKLQSISLLDVACGGGDVPIGMAAAAKQSGLNIDLLLLDQSATALDQAQTSANQAGINCRCIHADALTDFPDCQVDVITNSLFLHHVPEAQQAIDLMRKMRNAVRRMVVISDLERSSIAWATAWAVCRLVSRSNIVHHDGPASVRAAWTLQEFSSFAAQAGMNKVQIHQCWPWRVLMIWERDK